MSKTIFKRIIQLPIIRIVIGGVICILLPVLVNKLLLDNVFQAIGLNDNLNRVIRVFITTVILMPSLYYLLFKKLEKRDVTELQLKKMSIPLMISFITSVVIISFSFVPLVFIENIKIQSMQLPNNVIVNIVLILGFVITEEIFFRGILYRIVELKWGTLIALISSALIFSILHLSNEDSSIMSFLSVLAGGAILGILYTYTKNLIVPIVFHFGWNLIQVLLGFGLSGGNEFSELYVFKLNIINHDILTGGVSGIENSIISIVILFLLFIALYKKSYDENRITKPYLQNK